MVTSGAPVRTTACRYRPLAAERPVPRAPPPAPARVLALARPPLLTASRSAAPPRARSGAAAPCPCIPRQSCQARRATHSFAKRFMAFRAAHPTLTVQPRHNTGSQKSYKVWFIPLASWQHPPKPSTSLQHKAPGTGSSLAALYVSALGYVSNKLVFKKST